jgi:flagellar hook-basal body complex protein FliE
MSVNWVWEGFKALADAIFKLVEGFGNYMANASWLPKTFNDVGKEIARAAKEFSASIGNGAVEADDATTKFNAALKRAMHAIANGTPIMGGAMNAAKDIARHGPMNVGTDYFRSQSEKRHYLARMGKGGDDSDSYYMSTAKGFKESDSALSKAMKNAIDKVHNIQEAAKATGSSMAATDALRFIHDLEKFKKSAMSGYYTEKQISAIEGRFNARADSIYGKYDPLLRKAGIGPYAGASGAAGAGGAPGAPGAAPSKMTAKAPGPQHPIATNWDLIKQHVSVSLQANIMCEQAVQDAILRVRDKLQSDLTTARDETMLLGAMLLGGAHMSGY